MRLEKILIVMVVVFLSLLVTNFSMAEETGVTKNEIRIGCTLDLTGPIAAEGQKVRKGMESYFNMINERGGIYERKIRYFPETDNYEPSQTIAAAKKLIHKDKVFCFNGTIGTPTNMALIPVLENNKIPLIGPIGSSPKFAYPPKRYIFTTFALYSTQTIVPIDYVINTLKKNKIAMFYQDDEFGESCVREAEAYLKKYNMQLHTKVAIKRGAVDASPQAARLRKTDPEIIVLAVCYPHAAFLIREAHKMGWDVDFMALPTVTDKKLIELAGPELSEGIIGTSVVRVVNSDAPAVVNYRNLLDKYFPGSEPGTFGLWGFSCAKILVEGLKRTGQNLNRENLVNAMETMKDYDNGIVPPITYGEKDREGVTAVLFNRVENGRFVKISDWVSPKK